MNKSEPSDDPNRKEIHHEETALCPDCGSVRRRCLRAGSCRSCRPRRSSHPGRRPAKADLAADKATLKADREKLAADKKAKADAATIKADKEKLKEDWAKTKHDRAELRKEKQEKAKAAK